MNIVIILLIIGFLPVVILAFATFRAMYRNAKAITSIPVPVSGGSPRETARRMVKAVRNGYFLRHTLVNAASRFNDLAVLKKYIPFIRNSSVINFIQNVKGWHENE